jgi:TolB protein
VDDSPEWSPDGRRIAYVSQNASGGYVIKLMNADGTGQSQLTTISLDRNCRQYCNVFGLSWSPLGTKIAFTDGFGSQLDIFTINIDGSNRVNITNHPAFDLEPSFSPDGSRILFISDRFVNSGSFLTMHTMNADGSDVRVLPSDGEFWDTSPDWSTKCHYHSSRYRCNRRPFYSRGFLPP